MNIRFCRKTGMLSNGVKLPDSKNMITNTGIDNNANCGIEFVSVANRMLSDDKAKR